MIENKNPPLFPALEALSSRGRELFAASARNQACADRTQLIAKGDEVAGAVLVRRGALRIYHLDADGREGTLYWVEPGQSCILALNCVFSRLTYPAWVEAEGECEIMIVPGEAFRRLFAEEETVRNFTFAALSERLFELMALVEQTASKGLEARVAALLLRLSRGSTEIFITQDQIARHLSTSREVVSRVLRGLGRRRLIASAQKRVCLLDAQALRDIAS